MPTKPFWQSKTIWGVITLLVSSLAQQFGLGPEAGKLVPAFAAVLNTATPFVLASAQFVGLVMAIVGRFGAHKTQITLTPMKALPAGVTKALVLLALLPLGLMLGGCATGSTGATVLSSAEAYAWQLASALETANSGTPLDQSIATQVESLTGAGPKTTAEANIAVALVNTAISAGEQAKAAGATPAGIQAAQAAVLSDQGVIENAAASGTSPTSPTATPIAAP